MRSFIANPLLLWAVRDLFRRPMDSVLIAVSLASLAATIATALLLTQTLDTTAHRALSRAPSLVIRRIHPTGWAPIPEAEAVDAAQAVIGVVKAVPRIWGIVNGPQTPLTVIGINHADKRSWLSEYRLPIPELGQAIVGPGVATDVPIPTSLTLTGHSDLIVNVIGRLPPEFGIVAQDTILLHPQDARLLLGMSDGFASDLAIDVFHSDEAGAIAPDLEEAFPWPVRITTRKEAASLYSGGFSRHGGLFMLALLPAVLAMGYIVAGTVRDRFGRRYEAGLLKAVGWRSGDLISLWMIRALIICIPSTLAGISLAFGLVFWPGIDWPARLFFGWTTKPPELYLDSAKTLVILLELFGVLLVPYMAATLIPAVKTAMAEPQQLLEKD